MMKDIRENTVSAENQTVNSSDLCYLGDENAPLKILVVGNSITRHGPKEEIGWTNDWGMAASAPEKDYVHLLYSMFKATGKSVYMRIRQGAYWERHYDEADVFEHFAADRAFDADIVIFRLGENIPPQNHVRCKEKLELFIPYLCPNGKAVFATCFWKNPTVDEAIRTVAAARKEPCADIRCTADSQMALGQFWHDGVAMHPSDEGMEMIAKKIFELL